MNKKQTRKNKTYRQNRLYSDFLRSALRVILFIGVLCFMLLGVFKLTYMGLSNFSYFSLADVYVKDHFVLTGQDALDFSGLKKGCSLFSINLKGVSENIKRNHPEYEEVIVRRVLPSRIDVIIKERKAVFQIKLSKFYPIDKNGFIIPYARDTAYPVLPIIIGIEPREAELNRFSGSPRIKKALELISMINERGFSWRKNVSKINLTSLEDVSLYLNNGLEIKFGSGPYLEKMTRLEQVLMEIKNRSLEPAFVDLRFKDVIIAPR